MPIASAYPRPGFTKAEVNENIAYIKKEIARLYVSIAFMTGVPSRGIVSGVQLDNHQANAVERISADMTRP